jgi:hypothetical protein
VVPDGGSDTPYGSRPGFPACDRCQGRAVGAQGPWVETAADPVRRSAAGAPEPALDPHRSFGLEVLVCAIHRPVGCLLRTLATDPRQPFALVGSGRSTDEIGPRLFVSAGDSR